MKISLILAHPDPKSFNHAIAHTALETLMNSGHEVFWHDLYAEGFDPIIEHEEIPANADLPVDIASHCDEIAAVDGIIIVHPNWWGQPPAILKGWIDRVIRPKVAYQFLEGDEGEGIPEGLLKAKAAVVFNTSNTNPRREQEVFGDPLEALWKKCVFEFCGVNNVYRKMFSVVVTSTPEQRKAWLDQVRDTVQHAFP